MDKIKYFQIFFIKDIVVPIKLCIKMKTKASSGSQIW